MKFKKCPLCKNKSYYESYCNHCAYSGGRPSEKQKRNLKLMAKINKLEKQL